MDARTLTLLLLLQSAKSQSKFNQNFIFLHLLSVGQHRCNQSRPGEKIFNQIQKESFNPFCTSCSVYFDAFQDTEFAVEYHKNKSNNWRCSVKKVFFETSRNSQENSCPGVTF